MNASIASDIHPVSSDIELRRAAQWPIGLVVSSRWRICRLLGAGGMGSVFEAQHRNGKRVALKVLHRHLLANARLKTRFLREGYLANRVDHPDVVSVLDDGETAEGDVFLVMELLQGQTLERRRRESPLSLQEILWIADRVLDVLAAAHAKGIVHRDIKPANLFLTSEDEVKVLDFGIASLRDNALLSQEDPAGGLALSGGLGTPSYMAPEQARGSKAIVDERADLWSLGAVLYTLLTSRLVHETETPRDALIAAATVRPLLVRSLRPDLPEAVAEIVDRALVFETFSRWPSARAMQDAVHRVFETMGSDVAVGGSFVPTSRSLAEQATVITEKDAACLLPLARDNRSKQAKNRVLWAAGLCLAGVACIGGAAVSSSVLLASRKPAAGPPTSTKGDIAPPEPDGARGAGGVTSEATPVQRGETAPARQAKTLPDTRHDRPAPSAAVDTPTRSRRKKPTAPPASTPSTADATPPLSAPNELWRPDDSWLDRQK